MQFPIDIDGVTYDVAGAAQTDRITRLIAEVFSRDEPLAIAVGQSEAEFVDMLAVFLPVALPEGLTIAATADDAVTGVALATAFTSEPPPEIEVASPSYPPIGALIAELESDFERENANRLSTCLHIHMLAVDAAYRDRGIAQSLLEASEANGKGRGFTSMLADATNPTSRRAFERAGFKTVIEVRYDSFEFENQLAFAGLSDLGGIALMEKRL